MFRFLLRTLSLNPLRTLGIFLVFFLGTVLLLGSLFLYRNILSAVSYYTLQGVDEHRVTLTRSSSFFDLLDPMHGGIDPKIMNQIVSDPDITHSKIFRFIDVPVLGNFHIFQFGLTIDVPVFSVKDSEKVLSGIGMSSSMLHYYNLELAGSYPMFPSFRPEDLIGKKVDLTFGASKLFTFSGMQSVNYSSHLERIDPDYPGFGMVVDESVATEKLHSLDHSLANPYRIVLSFKGIPERTTLESHYPGLSITLDRDILHEADITFSRIRLVSLIVAGVLFTVLFSLLFFLFLGYLREKSSLYPLLREFRVTLGNEILLILGECILILMSALSLTLMILPPIQKLSTSWIEAFLHAHQILFPVVPLSFSDDIMIVVIFFSILVGLLFLLFPFRKRS